MEAARTKDTKERLAGVERLHEALDAAARRGLTAAEVTELVDTCVDLTRDANFRIAQGGLQALSAAAVVAGDHFKIHLNGLVPAAVERLGDGKQPVREAARQLLITLMEVSPPPPLLFICFNSLRGGGSMCLWKLDGVANLSLQLQHEPN
jgi:CLIP-associating protein 1/2